MRSHASDIKNRRRFFKALREFVAHPSRFNLEGMDREFYELDNRNQLQCHPRKNKTCKGCPFYNDAEGQWVEWDCWLTDYRELHEIHILAVEYVAQLKR